MKTAKSSRTLAFLGMLALAACEDGTPTAPIVEELFSLNETMELEVLASMANITVALELADASNTAAAGLGDVRAQDGWEFQDRARLRFADAQNDLARGDRRAALDKARDARRFIVRAIEATGGGRAVAAMVERLEAVASTIGEDVDSFDNPAAVAIELNALAASARDALSRGDTMRAGQRAVLGDQRTHDRRSRRGRDRRTDAADNDRGSDVGPRRADLALELGATAVALAERLLENDALDDEQSRFLATAHELLEKARAAFAEGHYSRAVHFAEAASWAALKAVVLPGGVTEEEMRAMLDLANSLHEEARVAIGDAPTEVQLSMFKRAGRLIELGEEMVSQGKQRGVAPLWRAAVISSWLIG
jgi:HEPN domain-containing protein